MFGFEQHWPQPALQFKCDSDLKVVISISRRANNFSTNRTLCSMDINFCLMYAIKKG
ncbi:hypothetical protein D3C86_1247600 [compost metagenome]